MKTAINNDFPECEFLKLLCEVKKYFKKFLKFYEFFEIILSCK